MTREETINYIKSRMDALGYNQRSLSLKAGHHEDTLRNYFRGNSQSLSKEAYDAIMKIIGLPGTVQKAVTVMNSDTVEIPVYDVALSAGGGSVIQDENIKYYLTFRLDWLRSVTPAPLEMLAILTVDGDSMEPTLSPGDSVLVDLTQTTPRRDGIYALRYDGAALVKRIQIDPVRRLATIISDNPAYPPIAKTNPNDIQVFGRVIWLGRRV